MSAFAFVLLMMLLSKQQGGGGGISSIFTPAVPSAPKPVSLPEAAAAAQADAKKATELARQTRLAQHAASAKQKQTTAAVLTQAAKTQAAAKTTPPPWPQAKPNGLPPFPAGWVPHNPPPQAVQTRAWQLLPVLWKQGANARKSEQTAGEWVTYVAQAMGAKKGVVAYKVRPGAMPTASPSPAPPSGQANA
jgi:hypothetical protein